MGLDMYLTKKTYVKRWSHHSKEEQHTVVVKLGGKTRKGIKPKRISNIEEEVMYWRKANQIHKWFVDNVQDGVDDCGTYYVSKEQLEELVDKCKKVLADNSLADELLPSESGFFFGGTEYDEFYFKDLEETVKEIEDELKIKPTEGCYSGDYYYHSSW